MPSTQIRPDQSLAEIAATRAGAAATFLRRRLDFCCHGQTSLAEACQEKGLDPRDLIADLELAAAEQPPFEEWTRRSLDELIDHILINFHERHRKDLPSLIQMAKKVETVHAENPACPKGLAEFLELLEGELEQHMLKEEQILFPLIRAGRGSQAAMPVSVMEQEHEDHGRNLARLRSLAGDFEPPAEACATWRGLTLGLSQLEADLMTHIHLENNILFPRALRS